MTVEQLEVGNELVKQIEKHKSRIEDIEFAKVKATKDCWNTLSVNNQSIYLADDELEYILEFLLASEASKLAVAEQRFAEL